MNLDVNGRVGNEYAIEVRGKICNYTEPYPEYLGKCES